jgi:hypothetical protein
MCQDGYALGGLLISVGLSLRARQQQDTTTIDSR